jgi:hypothetical protein
LSFEVMSSAKTSADRSNRFPFGVANLVSSLKPDAATRKLNRIMFLLLVILFWTSILAPYSSATSLQHTSIQEITVAGVVQDQTGAPVTGAEVTIAAPSFSARSKTDSAGQFHFERVPRTLVELAITVQGFAPVERKLNANGEDTRKLQIILGAH